MEAAADYIGAYDREAYDLICAHIGGLDGTSKACFNHLKVSAVDHNVNDYAGDGLDSRYEDDCARACGL